MAKKNTDRWLLTDVLRLFKVLVTVLFGWGVVWFVWERAEHAGRNEERLLGVEKQNELDRIIEQTRDQNNRLKESVEHSTQDIDRLRRELERIKRDSKIASKPFPEDGWIATMSGGSASDARTSSGEHFSILTDSAWGGESHLWYERINESDAGDGNGFLRIHYSLAADADIDTPYVGVFANFRELYQPMDVSAFQGVRIKVRHSGERESELDATDIDERDVELVFALADTTPRESDDKYAYPEYVIPPESLSEQWNTVQFMFNDLKKPPWAHREYGFNPKEVFRFIISIKGKSGTDARGYVDIDEIIFR